MLNKYITLTALSSLVQACCSLFFFVMSSRYLNSEDFGLFAITNIFISLGMVVCNLGIGQALIKEKKKIKKTFTILFIFALLLGFTLSLLFNSSAAFIAGFFELIDLEELITLSSIVFVLASPTMVTTSILEKKLKFLSLAKVYTFVSIFSYLIVGTILLLCSYGVNTLVYVSLLYYFLLLLFQLGLSFEYFTLSLKWDDFVDCKNRVVEFASWLSLARIVNYLALQMDNFLIGKFMGSASLGIYNRGYQLVDFVVRIYFNSVDKVLFPVLCNSNECDLSLILIIRQYMLRIAFCVAMFVFFNAALISELIFPSWSGIDIVLSALAFAIYFRIDYKFSETIIKAHINAKNVFFMQLVNALLIFSLVWVGIAFELSVGFIACLVVLSLVILSNLVSIVLCKKLDIPTLKYILLPLMSLKLLFIVGSVVIVFIFSSKWLILLATLLFVAESIYCLISVKNKI